ncbi:MAG: hypothetical protein P1S60_14150 [Anaerolineae bacterium]|nr:hypothetical protein [Anaerolineae bacterium]
MAKIHLVYPSGPRISTPDAIGRNLALQLRERFSYEVILHKWSSAEIILPNAGDVLIGHPHPYPKTCFRLSLRQPGWKRILALGPYNHGDGVQVAFYESFIRRCNLYLAITGNYWFDSISRSPFAHWRPKMRHLDLAVDRNDFPILKHKFNPPGQRQFVYIGHSGWTKNPRFLEKIAQRMPNVHFSWIGAARRRHLAGFHHFGYQDFSTTAAKQLISTFDFMITTSKSDANPTTILEAMAWGLIPVSTPQSGYIGYPGIRNIPLEIVKTVEILQELQHIPDTALREMQLENWQALDMHFNWDHFTQQIVNAIESNANPSIPSLPFHRWLMIHYLILISPHSPLRTWVITNKLTRLILNTLRREKA